MWETKTQQKVIRRWKEHPLMMRRAPTTTSTSLFKALVVLQGTTPADWIWLSIIHRPSAVALAFWVSLGAPRTERSSWDNRKVTHFGAVKSSLATLSQPTVHAKPSKHPKRNSQRKEHLVSSTYPASLKFGGSDSSWLAKSSSYCLQFQCSRVLSRIIKRIDISSKQKSKPSPLLASWRQEMIWSTFSKKNSGDLQNLPFFWSQVAITWPVCRKNDISILLPLAQSS